MAVPLAQCVVDTGRHGKPDDAWPLLQLTMGGFAPLHRLVRAPVQSCEPKPLSAQLQIGALLITVIAGAGVAAGAGTGAGAGLGLAAGAGATLGEGTGTGLAAGTGAGDGVAAAAHSEPTPVPCVLAGKPVGK